MSPEKRALGLIPKPKLIDLFFFRFCHLGILKQRQKFHFPHLSNNSVLSFLKSRAPLNLCYALPPPASFPSRRPPLPPLRIYWECCPSLSFRCQPTCHTSEALADPELELGTRPFCSWHWAPSPPFQLLLEGRAEHDLHAVGATVKEKRVRWTEGTMQPRPGD